MAVQVGDQVGEYRLVRELGSGTFGTVYQAEHVLLGTQVAIKVLHGQMTEAERQALRAEARRQAALEHAHIVPVLTYAEQPVPYLVMKYAPNGTLARRYPDGQRQPLGTVLPHVRQIAEGLQHAHDQQTLHLDLKPANILLGRQQEALITDFGISLILHQQKTHQTVGHIAGTPAYMAPEQLQGKPGKASDQYALATMVYQWLTGTLPFTGDVWSMGMQKLSQDPPPLRQHAPDLPPAVEQMVLKALTRDPQNRFASVQAFANALMQPSQAEPTEVFVPAPTQAIPPPPPPIGTLLLTYQGHTGYVTAIAWSPDSRRLASGGGYSSNEKPDNTVQVWDATGGQRLLTYTGHTDRVQAVAWSPDGRRLASAGMDMTVQVWDAATGQHLFTYTGHDTLARIISLSDNNNGVFTVAWSPDGRRLASAGSDFIRDNVYGVRVWDAASGQHLFTYTGHDNFVRAVAWSPDGCRLASASADNTVQIWDATTGQHLLTYAGHTNWVTAIAWSPNGAYRLASASADNTVQVWDASGSRDFTLTGHTASVYAVAWSPNSHRLVSVGRDDSWVRSDVHSVQVWHADGGGHLYTYSGHARDYDVFAVAWSPDGSRIASGGDDKTVQVWSAG